jgi:hypothetical protein
MTAATGSEQTVVVPAGADMVVAHVEGHSWVALRLGDEDLIIDRSGEPAAIFVVEPGSYVVHTDGSLGEIATQAPDPAAAPGATAAVLRLTIDAPDNHAADGVAELPADGSAFGTVTVAKHDLAGAALTSEDDADDVFLRTTGGLLQDAKGSGPIRSVTLRRGVATFRVVADGPPRFVTVTAFTGGPGPAIELPIEFV